MLVWMTQKRAKNLMTEMINKCPKGFKPYKFLIGGAIKLKKYEIKGIKIEYHSLLEKDRILLVDKEHYKKLIKH